MDVVLFCRECWLLDRATIPISLVHYQTIELDFGAEREFGRVGNIQRSS